jgi:adenylate cyclase
MAGLKGAESVDYAAAPSPRPPPLPEKPSIAVLAFDNLSGDPDQEYFADGMVEEIIPRSNPLLSLKIGSYF